MKEIFTVERFELFTSVNKTVKRLFIGSCILFLLTKIVLIKSCLINIPVFCSLGSIFSQFVQDLSLSTLASVIFYFFIVHIKNYNDSKNIKPLIEKIVNSLISRFCNSFNQMANARQITFNEKFPNETEILNMCQTTSPNDLTTSHDPYTFQPLNWQRFLYGEVVMSNDEISQLFAVINFLPAPLIEILYNLKKCNYFGSIIFNSDKNLVKTTDFIFLKEYILAYSEIIKSLSEYELKVPLV